MWQWLSRAVVSSEAADWQAECFSWAMQNFDVTRFRSATPLILPTNEYFPRKVESSDGMAQYVFGQVVAFCGLQSWPWELVPPERFKPEVPPVLGLNPSVRGDDETHVLVSAAANQKLTMTYSRDQVAQPQHLVATMAHGVAQHMLWQSELTPPGGQEFFLQTAEMLAVFMGFGLMVANSAYSFRGSCAKCYNPSANRQASLSESESVYALAVFCDLQRLDRKTVCKNLKSYLIPSFKSALKQIERHPGTTYLQELTI